MPATAPATVSNGNPASRSIREKLLSILVAPGEVFEEVIASPHSAVHWRLPVLLNGLAGMILFLGVAPAPSDGVSSLGATRDFAGGRLIALMAIVLLGFLGTSWSALVLWLIGRLCLRARFSWLKALEIAGLTTVVLALESVTTLLLIFATGDVSARPALSLLVGEFDPANKVHQTLAALNLFHFWMAAVLAIGVARLAAVTVGEAAVWVFGYWIALRIVLLLLA